MARMNTAFVGVAGAALLAGGALVGAWSAPRAATGVPAVAVSEGAAYVPVTGQVFDDPVKATLLAVREGGGEVRSNAAGTLTGLTCAPDGTVASGSELARVDGQPVIALATAVPLWRDLVVGSSGDDVAAVQAELRRLGVAIPDTGRMDAATTTAVRAFVTARGVNLGKVSYAVGSIVLPVGATAWLTAPEVIAQSCELATGQQVGVGDPILTVAPTIVRLVVTGQPLEPLPGARVVTVDAAQVAVPDDGQLTDRAGIDAILATGAARAWLAGEYVDEGLSVTWSLAEPVTVASVPPASLVGLAAGSACLVARDGTQTPVTVVSSQLGRAFVRADDGASLPTEVQLDPTGTGTCG